MAAKINVFLDIFEWSDPKGVNRVEKMKNYFLLKNSLFRTFWGIFFIFKAFVTKSPNELQTPANSMKITAIKIFYWLNSNC